MESRLLCFALELDHQQSRNRRDRLLTTLGRHRRHDGAANAELSVAGDRRSPPSMGSCFNAIA
jgi:hypothetical protein